MAGLKTYYAKRKFDVTPEPRGKVATRRGHAFVIQKHDASRLHYDLRLELDGTMKSWAVTRGPSLFPGDKRLAVHVEDHPIQYNKFEGTIPKGQYGGGTVMIWDRGTWIPEGDPHKGYKKGHLAFTLEGEKLGGAWHLVRMHKRPGEKHENWLLIKSKDDAARGKRDKDILVEKDLSVATGRSMDEIAGAKKGKVWQSNRPLKENVAALAKAVIGKKPAAAKPAKAAKPPAKKAKAKENKPAVRKSKRTKEREPVAGARRGPLPDFVEPCLATLGDKAPSADNWIHEIKFDGYRIQARIENGSVALLTRKGLNWAAKFKPIADALSRLDVDTALLDGEIVSEHANGLSDFSQLQQDLKAGRVDRMVYYVFDLLHLDGQDLRPATLDARKDALAKLLPDAGKTGTIRLSESLEDSGPVLHKHACRLGLEGIISKLRDAPYHSGRGYDWLKTKCADRQEFVVAGYTPSTADSRAIGALVLGYYEKGALRYAGRVGSGYTHQVARDLYRRLEALRADKCPFGAVPAEERGRNGARWVKPSMVVEAQFHGWTHGERVRQASFQGVREDKPPQDITREVKVMATKALATKAAGVAKKKSATPAKRGAKTGAKKAAPVKAGAITLTHPERVYWADAGVTKQDLANYYTSVWDWIKPHVTKRPLALVRCPEGYTGECFFQKHASAGLSEKHLRLTREPDGDKNVSIDDLDGLLSLVQAGVLEIHTRGSTIDHLESADRLVFDLDPGPGVTWKDMLAAARDVRERLQGIKLETFVKTSGGKGLHVVLPIKPAPWEEAKQFCRTLAEVMAADSPDRYIATIAKKARDGKIFIDYLRNSREATAIAPYSTRARAGAPVSVPLTWSELGSVASADRYTVLNLAQRLGRLRKDPWADISRIKQSLPKTGRRATR